MISGERPLERLRRRIAAELEALEGELGRMESGAVRPPDAAWAVPLYRRLVARRRRLLARLFPADGAFSADREACAAECGP